MQQSACGVDGEALAWHFSIAYCFGEESRYVVPSRVTISASSRPEQFFFLNSSLTPACGTAASSDHLGLSRLFRIFRQCRVSSPAPPDKTLSNTGGGGGRSSHQAPSFDIFRDPALDLVSLIFSSSPLFLHSSGSFGTRELHSSPFLRERSVSFSFSSVERGQAFSFKLSNSEKESPDSILEVRSTVIHDFRTLSNPHRRDGLLQESLRKL